jgi:hypothetical protein
MRRRAILPSITRPIRQDYSRPWSPSFAFRVDDALERVLCAEIARLRRRIGEDAFHLCARQLAVQSPCVCALRLRHISHAIVDFFWRSRAAPARWSLWNTGARVMTRWFNLTRAAGGWSGNVDPKIVMQTDTLSRAHVSAKGVLFVCVHPHLHQHPRKQQTSPSPPQHSFPETQRDQQ